ncbi:hypothetical protein FOVSG1_005647 [Fusarium oxysporum f. sp. vasinfectum]
MLPMPSIRNRPPIALRESSFTVTSHDQPQSISLSSLAHRGLELPAFGLVHLPEEDQTRPLTPHTISSHEDLTLCSQPHYLVADHHPI